MEQKATRTHIFQGDDYGEVIKSIHICIRAWQMRGWDVVHVETVRERKLFESFWFGSVIVSAPLSSGEKDEGLFLDPPEKPPVRLM